MWACLASASRSRRWKGLRDGAPVTPALYLAFIAATALLIATPGPNVALIVANSVAYGRRFGMLTVLAASCGQIPQIALTAFGMTSALSLLAQAFDWLRWPGEETRALLGEMFGAVGAGAFVRAPFHCDYGYNIRLGRNVFLNFDCVVLDVAPVEIGDDAQIGPGVQILTADHPREAQARREGLEFGRPVSIGRNAWIGGGAIVLPGVRIGDDAIVGAGAVVTRDVAAGATVAGNPARILKRS